MLDDISVEVGFFPCGYPARPKPVFKKYSFSIEFVCFFFFFNKPSQKRKQVQTIDTMYIPITSIYFIDFFFSIHIPKAHCLDHYNFMVKNIIVR